MASKKNVLKSRSWVSPGHWLPQWTILPNISKLCAVDCCKLFFWAKRIRFVSLMGLTCDIDFQWGEVFPVTGWFSKHYCFLRLENGLYRGLHFDILHISALFHKELNSLSNSLSDIELGLIRRTFPFLLHKVVAARFLLITIENISIAVAVFPVLI